MSAGWCLCGHARTKHPSPHVCARCSCGEYVDVDEAKARQAKDQAEDGLDLLAKATTRGGVRGL